MHLLNIIEYLSGFNDGLYVIYYAFSNWLGIMKTLFYMST